MNALRFLRDWWWSRQRAIDLEILWPSCVRQAPTLDHAKAAFAYHAFRDPAWIGHFGHDRLVSVIDTLSPPEQTDRAQLEALLARVEKATGADEALDLAIAQAMKEPIAYFRLVGEDGAGASTAPYTSSLDAALALVERRFPGWDWSVHHHKRDNPPHRAAWAGVRALPKGVVSGVLYEANGHTPALAVLSALLRAEIARGDGE